MPESSPPLGDSDAGPKQDALARLRQQVAELVSMTASELGGLTPEEADGEWWDEITWGVVDGLESATKQPEGQR